MQAQFQRSLFIFRRDLRLEDNTGLIFALQNSKETIPAFILTPEQIEHNPYRSDYCLRFMLESLEDLSEQLKKNQGSLYLFQGDPATILEKCIKELKIDAFIINQDYTPYSVARDAALEKICKTYGVSFHTFHDALLHPPEDAVKTDFTPYTVFTPYFKNASKLIVQTPVENHNSRYFRDPISFQKKLSLISNMQDSLGVKGIFKGGRSEALKHFKALKDLKDYDTVRDFPEKNLTSHCSAYLKFTLVSPREAYVKIKDALGEDHGLIRSLYWRDFFSHIAWFFPHVFKGNFREKFDDISWSYSKKDFHRWCEGQTGFPIVDAALREMNQTGFMHNRARMIAASFLVKDLHIDWRWGEKYFAQTLIDYDPAVNNGNWQWVAGTGCDAQPYFRIFNPWSQQKKFDPDCVYIKKWIPELKKLPPKIIHQWDQATSSECSEYPLPMLDHSVEAKKALDMYLKALK